MRTVSHIVCFGGLWFQMKVLLAARKFWQSAIVPELFKGSKVDSITTKIAIFKRKSVVMLKRELVYVFTELNQSILTSQYGE